MRSPLSPYSSLPTCARPSPDETVVDGRRGRRPRPPSPSVVHYPERPATRCGRRDDNVACGPPVVSLPAHVEGPSGARPAAFPPSRRRSRGGRDDDRGSDHSHRHRPRLEGGRTVVATRSSVLRRPRHGGATTAVQWEWDRPRHHVLRLLARLLVVMVVVPRTDAATTETRGCVTTMPVRSRRTRTTTSFAGVARWCPRGGSDRDHDPSGDRHPSSSSSTTREDNNSNNSHHAPGPSPENSVDTAKEGGDTLVESHDHDDVDTTGEETATGAPGIHTPLLSDPHCSPSSQEEAAFAVAQETDGDDVVTAAAESLRPTADDHDDDPEATLRTTAISTLHDVLKKDEEGYGRDAEVTSIVATETAPATVEDDGACTSPILSSPARVLTDVDSHHSPPDHYENDREAAAHFRAQGKAAHDQGQYARAARLFRAAAVRLRPTTTVVVALSPRTSSAPPPVNENVEEDERENEDDEEQATESSSASSSSSSDFGWVEDYITCRLHEALCQLKLGHYTHVDRICTTIINGDLNHGDDNNDEEHESTMTTPDAAVGVVIAPALRARALHRRAKARLALGDADAALADARTAAYLGDHKAVVLYGTLMRRPTTTGSGGGGRSSTMVGSLNRGTVSSESSPWGGANGALDLLSGINRHNNAPPALGSGSSDLLQSLLGKSEGTAGDNGFSPLSLLGLGGGGGGGAMAKSVLSSLAKRIDDEGTQHTICQYLHGASAPQLQQLAGMAGMELPSSYASSIATWCHSVTPRTLRRTVSWSKRAMYVVQVVRKMTKLLKKYRGLILLLILCTWIKSAIVRPIPINRRLVKKTAKAFARAAMGEATNPSV